MALDLATVDPALVCRALAPLLLDERRARIDAVVAARLGGLRVVIEDLHDPHNGAAVLRSCEATGIQRVEVVESREPFRASAAVTQGCDKWLDVVRHATLDACVRAMRADGFALYAAVPGAAATVDDVDFARPAAILVGNEHDGLSAGARAAADVEIAIPLSGMTRSLNLSVATALLAERAARRRREALGSAGDLDEPARVALRARFYALDVRGAAEVVERALGRRRRRPSV